MKKINIVYHVDGIDPIEMNPNGNWIDLRAADTYELKKGDFALISLGVSMEIPKGYEALIIPRSSTFKNWGIIQTNHVGLIDESYNGTDDIWYMPVLATRHTLIEKNSRVCQFRLLKRMKPIQFNIVDKLKEKNRGGFGSTGVK